MSDAELVAGDETNTTHVRASACRRDREPLSVIDSLARGEQGGSRRSNLTGPLLRPNDVVGFGERFDALDQHGRALDTVVYEQYKNQGNRTYLPIPFFLSSEDTACWSRARPAVDFDIGRTVPDRWRCLAQVPASGRFAFRSFYGEPDTIVRR